ncbi:unnamed protein product [Rodentolepis nana]|uniref:Suppressor of fused protein (SUFU) n=1 Tax=Rodentolepis nana TaxID=102285 RepID=A0A0R3T4I2_RODNA|nr:unnamed protein product [Rodentolepis nana]
MANITILKEIDDLFEWVSKSECGKIIEPLNCTRHYVSFRILRDPGGQIVIFPTPKYPDEKPGWIISVGDKKIMDTNEGFPEASTITQAFMCCLYVILNRMQVEMPQDIIELDENFKGILDSVFPGIDLDALLK